MVPSRYGHGVRNAGEHLAPDQYVASSRLRKWCEQNKNQHYIPEWLLNALSTMEHGKIEIGAEILLRISREFGKTIEWLLAG
jgi:hypothetical protein